MRRFSRGLTTRSQTFTTWTFARPPGRGLNLLDIPKLGPPGPIREKLHVCDARAPKPGQPRTVWVLEQVGARTVGPRRAPSGPGAHRPAPDPRSSPLTAPKLPR